MSVKTNRTLSLTLSPRRGEGMHPSFEFGLSRGRLQKGRHIPRVADAGDKPFPLPSPAGGGLTLPVVRNAPVMQRGFTNNIPGRRSDWPPAPDSSEWGRVASARARSHEFHEFSRKGAEISK